MSGISNDIRVEEDLLGQRDLPASAYYGIHTLRASENFNISSTTVSDIPELVRGMVFTKKAAAKANMELGTIPEDIGQYIMQACDLMLSTGKGMDQFISDVYQGGAGTSVNMNANEVIANIALELKGCAKGAYHIIHPNDHINKSQSTNCAYPTGFRIAVYNSIIHMLDSVEHLRSVLNHKSVEYKDILKMGRTQLQDAVPMTVGQEFHAFSTLLKEEEKT